ncbi:uncharacterized protein V3H82_019089 isoform 1-T1 [Fundulus diaphanus]
MSGCCVNGCTNRYSRDGFKFYRIPRGNRPFQSNRRRLWLQAINREDWTEDVIKNARICGAHFISGEASLDWQSPDFVPSVFVNTKNSQSRGAHVERYNRKKRRDDNIDEPPDQPNSCETPEQQDESSMEQCPDVLKLVVIKEELPAEEQNQSPTPAHEDQKPPQIKEEQEDTDITKFIFDPVSVKREDDEEKPQLPDLLHCQTEESRETDQCLKSDDEDRTSNCSSETDISDGNWEESEAQSGIDSAKNNEVAFDDRKREKGKKLHICPDCGKTFRSRQGLLGHNRTHTGENPFSCPICNKTFSSKGNLQKHTKVHTGERPFKCSICGAALKSKNALIEHTRTHTGEKPFSCPLCGRSFGFRSYLTVHMKCHSEEKPHRCSVCTAAFKRKNALLAHIKTHTGEKPYSCSVCGKNFAHCVSLTCHMRSHTGERPYSCSVCKATFKWKNTFTNHTKIHSGE